MHPPDSFAAWAEAFSRGDLEAAWCISDAVLAARRASGVDCSAWPRHLQFIWTGAPVAHRHVLVRCYHGLGDTIQFVRFLAKLRARAARVTLWVQPVLIGLLESVAGIDALIPLHDGAPQVEYDLDMELMEVPHCLRAAPHDLRTPRPYLGVPAAAELQVPALGLEPAGLRVGLVWRAGGWDPRRSIAAEQLAPLARVPRVHWYSLQYPAEHLSFPTAQLGNMDLLKTAACITALDLVIAVDTMTAHLAGALGVPVWLLLPDAADWRWAGHPTRTAWYPSMRLLRQAPQQGWHPLVEHLRILLQRRVSRRANLLVSGVQAPDRSSALGIPAAHQHGG